MVGVSIVVGDSQSTTNQSSSSTSIPVESHKLAILLLWFATGVVSNWVVLAYIHDLVIWEPMPDPMFFLGQQEWAYALGDWMVSASFSSLCLLLIFHRHRLLLLRRLLFLLALLNSLRSLMILMTRLPSSYSDNQTKCRERVQNKTIWLVLERTWEQAIRLGLQDDSQRMLCGDQFFSGHTAMMTLSAFFTDYYLPGRWHLLSTLPKLFALIGIPCLVLSRTHYTSDVLVGYCISAFVFVTYHAICEIESVDLRRKSLLHRHFITAKVVHWFEACMPLGRLSNQLEVPFADKLLRKFRRRRRGNGKQQHHGKEASGGSISSSIFFVKTP